MDYKEPCNAGFFVCFSLQSHIAWSAVWTPAVERRGCWHGACTKRVHGACIAIRPHGHRSNHRRTRTATRMRLMRLRASECDFNATANCTHCTQTAFMPTHGYPRSPVQFLQAEHYRLDECPRMRGPQKICAYVASRIKRCSSETVLGARSRNRTGMALRPADFKSDASTSFAIRANAGIACLSLRGNGNRRSAPHADCAEKENRHEAGFMCIRWRPGSELNRRTRICSPLHNHSATRPMAIARDWRNHGTISSALQNKTPRTGLCSEYGAGNETRTRDPDLGKVVLYQLSYSRVVKF